MTRKELSEKIERTQALIAMLGKELTEAQREFDGFTGPGELPGETSVTPKMAAEHYGVCEDTIYRWIRHGAPFEITSSRKHIGRLDKVDRWVRTYKPETYFASETKEWKRVKATVSAKRATRDTNSHQPIPA